MYVNLEAELSRKRITRQVLAGKLKLAPSTLSLKLNGKSDISLPLAKEIKSILGVDIPIEILFDTRAPDKLVYESEVN